MTITKAILDLAQKELLPTSMNTAQLRTLASDVRAASIFSARVNLLEPLEQLQSLTDRMLSGEINQATARYEMQVFLDRYNYSPEIGLPGGAPATPGSIEDLSSDARINLQLDTMATRAAHAGMKLQGTSEDALYQFPAWELVRLEVRQKPRDEMPDADEHWDSRFEDAGGTLIDGRMVALKDDEVWNNLGEVRDDGIPGDVPPYAFNSGMGWDEIPRDEAIELGLISEDDVPELPEGRFFEESNLNVDDFSDDDIKLLLKGLRA